MSLLRWNMSSPHIILDHLPSLCQKLSDLVQVWRSYNKNNFAFFIETRCISCFSIFSSNFFDFESGVTICIRNQFPIRRLDRWRHRARDHSTRHRPLAFTYWRFSGRKPLSPAIFEIMGTEDIGVTTLTFQGHVTSSVTWPFDSGWSISYWWSFGPKSVSLTVSEIFSDILHP